MSEVGRKAWKWVKETTGNLGRSVSLKKASDTGKQAKRNMRGKK